MAQRVYLIPVRADVVRLFEALVLCPPEAEPAAFKALLARAAPHRRAAQFSRNLCAGLNEEALTAAGRAVDHERAACSRPYAITETSVTAAVDAVDAILADGGAQAETVLKRQVGRLREFWSAPAEPGRSDKEDWQCVQQDLAEVKGLRAAALERRGHAIKTAKPVQFENAAGELVQGWSQDESIDKILSVEELGAQYGQRLGALFGRLAGLCDPTWWLGCDYWFGNMLFSDWPDNAAECFVSFRQGLRPHTSSPADFLRRVAVPGFEAGLGQHCDGYSSGLCIVPEKIPHFRGLLNANMKLWNMTGAATSPLSGEWLALAEQMALEALLWAERHGCGLMEGDELVGSYGYR